MTEPSSNVTVAVGIPVAPVLKLLVCYSSKDVGNFGQQEWHEEGHRKTQTPKACITFWTLSTSKHFWDSMCWMGKLRVRFH